MQKSPTITVLLSIFRCGCGLWKALGSPSVDGWGCDPTLLVVWSEVFQHWSLQAVGWDQVSMQKWQSLEHTPRNSLIIKVLVLPVATSDSWLPKRLSRLSGRFMGSYGVTALPWVPVHMKICVNCPRVESLFPQVLQRPCTQALLAFKDKCSGPLLLNARTPEPNVGLRTFTSLSENFWNVFIFQFVRSPSSQYEVWLYSKCALFFVFACRIFFLIDSTF